MGEELFGIEGYPSPVVKIDTPPSQERKPHHPLEFLTLSTFAFDYGKSNSHFSSWNLLFNPLVFYRVEDRSHPEGKIYIERLQIVNHPLLPIFIY